MCNEIKKETEKNHLECTKSDKLFINQQDLEIHEECEHSSEEEDNGEVKEIGQKGGMS